MEKLKHCKGESRPNLKFTDFSEEFLLKVLTERANSSVAPRSVCR